VYLAPGRVLWREQFRKVCSWDGVKGEARGSVYCHTGNSPVAPLVSVMDVGCIAGRCVPSGALTLLRCVDRMKGY
jgi:hypothetical protein